MAITLDGHSLNLESAMRVAVGGSAVKITPESLRRMAKFRSVLEQKISRGEMVYGVDTGIGSLAGRPVRAEDLEELQLNLVRSHSAGVGDPMPLEVVRAAMLIRINSLLIGNSAARPIVAEHLAGLLNKGVIPYVPRFGSLGASGDLIPSAHMALTMIGEGKAHHGGRVVDSARALSASSMNPLVLKAKEGLSLINGTCFTTALGAIAVHDGMLLLEAGNSSVALAAEALGACSQSFDAKLIGMKKSRGQDYVAKRLRKFLTGSRRIRQEPLPQDPYSIRCAPQVHGSVKEALDFAEPIVVGEMNSVSDNPVLFEDGTVLHGGNFHAQPVAMALDLLSIALSYLGVMSLARISVLLTRTPQDRKFMARRPGLESGLMILQYTAMALAADNATQMYPQSAYPASVSEGIEDHASHGVNAGMKARAVIANVSRILAIELICASNRFPSNLDGVSAHSRRVCAEVRGRSPLLDGDRALSEDIERVTEAITAGKLP
ncbi:MAG: HAL/PAL/TAL family ammonia-lyase [Nitrososphaerales archaeon]